LTMNSARSAAVVTWAYAAGFGVSAVPVAVYLHEHGRLPSFFGLFDMFAGPWSQRLPPRRFLQLLVAFTAVTTVAAVSAADLWKGRRRGGALNLALLPVEAVFWIGFALPIPAAVGLARIALVGISWTGLRPHHTHANPGASCT